MYAHSSSFIYPSVLVSFLKESKFEAFFFLSKSHVPISMFSNELKVHKFYNKRKFNPCNLSVVMNNIMYFLCKLVLNWLIRTDHWIRSIRQFTICKVSLNRQKKYTNTYTHKIKFKTNAASIGKWFDMHAPKM